MTVLRQTPLTEWHRSNGGRLVDFAGWEMPVRYDSVIAEHMAVRQQCGLFDVSHMGELAVRGPGARDAVNRLVTNDVGALQNGQVLYTAMCRENGTVLDDLLIYCFADDDFLVVCNAANHEKVRDWLKARLAGDVTLIDESSGTALLALQGPRSLDVLRAWSRLDSLGSLLHELAYYRARRVELGAIPAVLSRTGYTGEWGYEIYLPWDEALTVWEELMAAGAEYGLRPIGLGARDTLRLEAGYSLYGHELDEQTTPYEAGIGWVVKLKAGDFVGRDALARQKEEKPPRRTVALALEGRNIPREGAAVHANGSPVGHITSGTFSPVLQHGIGLARVSRTAADEPLSVEIRGRLVAAERVKLPFVPSRVKGQD